MKPSLVFFVLFLVLVGLVGIALKRKPKKRLPPRTPAQLRKPLAQPPRVQELAKPAVVRPEIQPDPPQPTLSIKITTSTNDSSKYGKADTGKVKLEGGAWVLNPKAIFRLSVEGVDRQTATRLKELLEVGYTGQEPTPLDIITGILVRSNVRCVQMEEYVKEWRPRYLKRIEELKANSGEWAKASEKDREDLLAEFEQQALDAVDVRPYGDLEPLLAGRPQNGAGFDKLFERYSPDIIQAYTYHNQRPDKVHRIPAGHHHRERFEVLTQKGLARRGSDIPISAILESFKLKEMNDLAEPLGLGPFKRKPPAIEALTSAPGIIDRLSTVIAFRELFQLQPLPDEFSKTDLGEVAASFAYARRVAEVLLHTYELASYRLWHSQYETDPDIQGWRILAAGDPCPYCASMAAKTYPNSQKPQTPFHLGCRCVGIAKTKYD